MLFHEEEDVVDDANRLIGHAIIILKDYFFPFELNNFDEQSLNQLDNLFDRKVLLLCGQIACSILLLVHVLGPRHFIYSIAMHIPLDFYVHKSSFLNFGRSINGL